MRLSIDPSNPAFHPMSQGVEVLVDGIRSTSVVTADTDEGWVEEYDRGDGEKFVEGPDGKLPVKRHYGRVEIRGLP